MSTDDRLRQDERQSHRRMPYSEEAEKGVIGSMLIGGPEVIEEMIARLSPDSFHHPTHQILFAALCSLHQARTPTDFITLTDALREAGMLDQVGGAAYVTECFTWTPTAANVHAYAATVIERHTDREIIRIGTMFASRGYDVTEDSAARLEEFQSAVIDIGQQSADANALRAVTKEEVMARLDNIEQRYHQRGQCRGLSTGFPDLDRMTDGLIKKQVYVFAGRPAMGKSSIGVNIAENIAFAAVGQAANVAIFAIEMTRDQIIDRVIMGRAKVSLQSLRTGFIAEAAFPRLAQSAQDLMGGTLFLDDTAGLSIAQFRSRARRAVVRFKCRLLIIDYVQIMKGSSKRGRDNRQLELAEIMQGIRETAKQLDVPIIVLAQLNRGAEDRPQSRPAMADLKECGAIEEEAHVVGLLYRPAYYAKTEAKTAEIQAGLDTKYGEGKVDAKDYAEIDLVKQRDGPTGPVSLIFRGEFTRFESITQKLYSNREEERQA